MKEVCAFAGLDQLQRRTNGIGGGVGCAAGQGVGQPLLDQHGTEVVGPEEHFAGPLSGSLALAQRYKIIHKPIHVGIGGRIEELQSIDVEAALGGCRLDCVHIADEHRREEAILLQTRDSFKDARVGALCVNEPAGIGLERLNETVNHCGDSALCGSDRNDLRFFVLSPS